MAGSRFGRTLAIASVAVLGLTGVSSASDLKGTALSPASVDQAVKSQTARLAETDPALLHRTDSTPINVVVKLDYDSVATYDGGEPGLAATNPAVTGLKLEQNASAVGAYERHVAGQEAQIVNRIDSAVPQADLQQSFRSVYGGVSMQVPANQIKDLLAVKGVVAVQQDKVEQPQTDVTPEFIGATSVWPALGGFNRAGQGVIVGDLDTGITPQHPSFQDPGIPRPAGTQNVQCQFGDGTDPLLGPPATCNDKLIGAYAFLNTYVSVNAVKPGEFCNQTTGKCSARDADGHGTHTASTAAGSPVASAPLFGFERGPISGIAPGASIIAYRVCGDAGCYQSDSVAAINQAIKDGVDVINFSIGGGAQPYTDAVELAFLDFYDAGGLANASAGNAGPGASTAEHGGPWTNTVGASTSPREFLSVLRLRSTNGTSFTAVGSTITPGIAADTPVVLAKTLGSNDDCTTPLPAGAATGKIVVCQGSTGRNAKAFLVKNGGGAGMILYANSKKNLFTDNFWVPTIMLDGPSPGNDMLAFVTNNPGVTARWQTGQPTPVRADEMTYFSSRGPEADFIKPDVTAPGLQILAGTTPTPWLGNEVAGPPGQLYQAIAGTSMSAPHATGVAALIRAYHPDWTPGQIKSAMMTSAVQDVVKEDGHTPADPFDRGAGSIRVDRAVAAPVTFDVSAASYVLSAADPLNRVNLNTPSIDAPVMAGELTTTRRMKNVSGRDLKLVASSAAPAGSQIVVTPDKIDLRPNQSMNVQIAILGKDLARGQQYFGEVRFAAKGKGDLPDTVLPVAFVTKQGVVAFSHTCAKTTIPKTTSTHCQVQATNMSPAPANAAISVTGAVKDKLEVRNVTPPATKTKDGLTWTGTLSPAVAPKVTAITPGGSPAGGYLPLSAFGIPPVAGAGDETIASFNVPAFKYGTETYTSVGMTSDGYAIVGGGTMQDVDFVPQTLPNSARPNNVIAPYWTDLNAAEGGTLRAGTLTDGVDSWIVLDWNAVPVFGLPAKTHTFEIWIQTGATEGISWAYGPNATPDPATPVGAGAENRDGTSGVNLALPATIPVDSDYTVHTTGPTPGGSVTLGYDAFGLKQGSYQLVARMSSDITSGVAAEPVNLTVTKKP